MSPGGSGGVFAQCVGGVGSGTSGIVVIRYLDTSELFYD
jgi:hypothetical protein